MQRDHQARIGEIAMKQACALEDHYPFLVREEGTEMGSLVFGYVRTTSAELDGCGGRTDVHDVLSLLWAAVLRAMGAVSSRLIDDGGFTGIPGEIYGRYLIFDQISESFPAEAIRDRINAHTGLAFHALDDVVRWNEFGHPQSTWTNGAKSLLEALTRGSKFNDFHEYIGLRRVPDWYYAKSRKGGITVAVFPQASMASIRCTLASYEPVCIVGKTRTSILAGNLKNAVSNRTISLGLQLLKAIEGAGSLQWNGADSSPLDVSIALIPIESHCILIGRQAMIAIRTDCGIRSYEAERTKLLERRIEEDAVFAADIAFVWTEKLEGGRFEDLVYSLLEREKGVSWVRQAGPTRERDGGRDFIARWTVSSDVGAPSSAPSWSGDEDAPSPASARNIVVQVKAHRPSVGKAKVIDIRDTIERHQAEGYFLVAFPQPTNSLVEHLLALARRGVWTNWWDRAQIESRLRKNLDLLARFSDLVTRSDKPS